MREFLTFLYSDPGHKADGEVVTRSEEQPEQIRQLHPEDADCYSTQRWRPNWAGQNGVNNKACTSLSCLSATWQAQRKFCLQIIIMLFSLKRWILMGIVVPRGDVKLYPKHVQIYTFTLVYFISSLPRSHHLPGNQTCQGCGWQRHAPCWSWHRSPAIMKSSRWSNTNCVL